MEFIATLLLEQCTMHSCCEMRQTCQLFVRPWHAAHGNEERSYCGRWQNTEVEG